MSDDIEIQFRGGYAKKWHSESTERFPKSSIAYRPGLIQRTSDIISLMYWGVSIMAPVRSFQKTIERMSVQS